MNWHPVAPKITILKIITLIALFCLSLLLLNYVIKANRIESSLSATDKDLYKISQVTQLGFYDLLSQKEELYDIQIQPSSGDSYISTITAVDDPEFILKANLIKISKNHQLHLDFTPIYYYNPSDNRMIDSFVDYASHHDMWIKQVTAEKTRLAVANGHMIVILNNL